MIPKQIRSYVLREGRMTPAQSRSLDIHWEAFGIAPEDIGETKDLYSSPLTVEVGFGMGDSLLEMAISYPERNFLGIEVHRPGVGHLLMGIHDNAISNLRVVRADGLSVLKEHIPASSVAILQLFFPDPWPKKKHHKRRLINPAFLDIAANVLRVEGIIHIATDWANYAEEIRDCLNGDQRFAETTPPNRALTKYEKRGVKLGHEVADIAYRLNK
ncbi:MAG: tRNA (guanosine(46)-N7)-methyltransferase TrmB [Pseudomonadales bacterium]|nr:tRNA (guanosine(46)-N7)-methyltransferase TrmB [Pseudomonadales bacterium]